MKKYKIYSNFPLYCFILISYLLLFIKINSLFNDYSIYNTSGVEVSTLNFLFNLINNNNILAKQNSNIVYEVYGLNFHYFYYPFVKFFQLFSIDYKLSSRLITFFISTLIPILILKIHDNIFRTKNNIENKNIFLYFLVFSFVISHQSTSWWSLTYRPDFLAIYFSLLSVFFFIKYIKDDDFIFACLSTFIALIAWTFKQNYLFCIFSIILYVLLNKEIKKVIVLLLLCCLTLITLNNISGYNNFDLLDRSVETTSNSFILKNYFTILIKFFIKNLYLIPLMILNYLLFLKIENKKIKLFIFLIFMFSFLQSSLVGTLQGAGKNHMISFVILNLISLPIIINYKNKIYYSFNLSLIFANLLMLFQIYNFNTLGRLTLHYNDELRVQKYEVFNYFKNVSIKPIIFFGVSGRLEMLLIEDVNGLDSHQLTSYKDPLWRQWMFFKDNKIDSFDKIFEEKFKKISTIVVLDKKKYESIINKLTNEQNFKNIKKINIKKYSPPTNYNLILKEIINTKKLKINKNKYFNNLEILIYEKTL